MTSCKDVEAGRCPCTPVPHFSCEMIDDAFSSADGTCGRHLALSEILFCTGMDGLGLDFDLFGLTEALCWLSKRSL